VQFIKNFIREEEGQDVVEYALVVGLVALAGGGALAIMAGGISGLATDLSAALAAIGATF
jgi:Flp pilus assembly pilin Flp